MIRRVFFLLFCLLPAHADTTVKRLAPGIVWTQEIDKAAPLVINVINVDLYAPGVRVGVGIAQDKISGPDPSHGRETVSHYAKRHETLAAVNADFFPFTGDPLGIGIQDGQLFSEPWAGKGSPRAAIAIGIGNDKRAVLLDTVAFAGDLQAADGTRFPLSGINRVPGPNEIVADFPIYGPNGIGRADGASVVLSPVSGTLRPNNLIVGKVNSISVNGSLAVPIPQQGAVLLAAPGAGKDFLNLHVHAGERVGFVAGVAPFGQTQNALQIASGSLPSRGDYNRSASVWTNVAQAVSGGPRLLRNGQVQIDGAAEGFDASFTDALNPRTAVGITRDAKHLIIVTVEGRQAVSKGVSLADLAQICLRFEAWNAINLDGGGSTTMSVAGLVVGDPNGEGAERPVADMLTIDSDRAFYKVQAAPASQIPAETVQSTANTVEPLPPGIGGFAGTVVVTVGQTVALHAHAKQILYQGMVTGGIGFVTQRGFFLAAKPGIGTVTALVDGQYQTQIVTVLPKQTPPALSVFALSATISPDTSQSPNRSLVALHIADKSGRPFPNARVSVVVTGGASDTAFVTTDEDGSANVGVTWENAAGGTVTLQSGTIPSVALTQP